MKFTDSWTEFQFHKGTIKTAFANNQDFSALKFQFHKGTIKTGMSPQKLANDYNFNSIKVRLKLR